MPWHWRPAFGKSWILDGELKRYCGLPVSLAKRVPRRSGGSRHSRALCRCFMCSGAQRGTLWAMHLRILSRAPTMSRVLRVRLGLATARWTEHHHTRDIDNAASPLYCYLSGAPCPAPRMSLKMHQRHSKIFRGKACASISFYLLSPDQNLSRLRTVPGCNQPIPPSAMATHLCSIHGGARRLEPGALLHISC